MAEADIRADRMRKLDLLSEAGMSAYPVETDRTMEIASFVEHFEKYESEKSTVVLAGRVMSRRGQGGIMFADLNDGDGRTQVVLQKAEMDEKILNGNQWCWEEIRRRA